MAAASILPGRAAVLAVLAGLAATVAVASPVNDTNESNATDNASLLLFTTTTPTTRLPLVAAATAGAAAASRADLEDELPPARQEGTWEAFGFHVMVCTATWAGLAFLSIVLGSCRASWEAERVERFLRSWAWVVQCHRIYLGLSLVIALSICVLYVLRAEFDAGDGAWEYLELAAEIVHGIETFILWLHATARSSAEAQQLVAGRLVVDCLLIPSVVVWGFQVRPEICFDFVASMRVLVLWKQLLESRPGRRGVRLHVLHAVVRLACGIFCAGALVRQVENIHGPQPAPTKALEVWTLEASAYFVLISMATVGYSDLSPRTYLGQALAAFIVVAGMWLMLRTSIGIMEALDSSRSGSGRYDRRRTRHVVVTGSPSFQVLRDFLLELYNSDLGAQCEELNAIVLLLPGQRHVVDQMRQFLSQPNTRRFAHSVWMVQGSALRHEDLERVNFRDASTAFLLPNLYAEDMEREDVDNIMRAISMHRCVPFVRVVALLLKEEHRDSLLAAGLSPGDIVCADELKHGLMAKSCEAQGFATLACGLFKRTGGLELDAREAKLPWLKEFLRGLKNEVLEVDLCPAYNGAPFGEVSLDIMLRSEGKAFLVGLVEEPFFPGDPTITKVFPGKHYKVGTSEDHTTKGIFVGKSAADVVQYPPGTAFPWRVDPDMRGAVAADGKEAAPPNLPGTVPEVVASVETEGWIREPRDIKAELADKLVKGSHITAAQWAAQGMRQTTKLQRARIQELIGLQAADDLKDGANAGGGGGQLSAEDDPEFMEDPTQKALLELELAEADQAAAATEAADEAKVMQVARRIVAVAEELENRRRARLEHADRDKDEDNLLWGSAPPAPPKSFGSEPRPAVLVRGDHVVVVAIEGPPLGQVEGAGTGDPTKRFGRKLGILHFVRSLRAGEVRQQRRPRVVVVVSEATPRDWKKVAAEGDVYLVLGDPLAASSLKRAGLEQAHAVVVHQRNASLDRDPSTVDAEAVFACLLVEKMAASVGRQLPVICDLHLDSSAAFLPFGLSWYEMGDTPGKDDDEEKERKPLDGHAPAFFAQSRFVSGHLYASGIATALAANMFYKPTLGHLMQELLRKRFVVVPVPEDFKGRTFSQLFEHLVRKSNLMPMALLRTKDTSEDAMEEQEELMLEGAIESPLDVLRPLSPGGRDAVVGGDQQERWHPGEPPDRRFCKLMPKGKARVVDQDAVLCAVASTGRVVFPPLGPPILGMRRGVTGRHRG